MNDEVTFSTEVALDSKGLFVQIFSILSYFEDITDLVFHVTLGRPVPETTTTKINAPLRLKSCSVSFCYRFLRSQR